MNVRLKFESEQVFGEIFETILMRYFWYFQKICNWPCFKFCVITKHKTGRLLQVLGTFLTLKRMFLDLKHTFLTLECKFLASKRTFLDPKCNLSFEIIFVTFSRNFFETILTQYFWYIQKFCNRQSYKFRETTKHLTGHLLQGLIILVVYKFHEIFDNLWSHSP